MPRTYDDLNDNEKKRYDADVHATNIVLQGLPKDIHKLINHNIEAKAILDKRKMPFSQVFSSPKRHRSQLYDEFERFKMLPVKTINEYYVDFTSWQRHEEYQNDNAQHSAKLQPRPAILQAGLSNASTLYKVLQIVLWTVRFGNDHFGVIMGYGDYVIGDSVISRSINGKKYILVIVDDFSRFTWVKFLRSKDETPAFVINLLKQLQVGLNKTVRFVRTDNGTKFVNKDLTDYYESVGITHEKNVPRTPQQNGVVEQRNCTLVEAARTMLIFSKAPLFLWA
ncbi:integrase, catalytic region, zinc finger, CCHC-type containing protein [Tanacetum coccineum]